MSFKNYNSIFSFTALSGFTESAATGDEFHYATDIKHKPLIVTENGSAMIAGTLGSLSAGEWAWGDNDSLGYSTIYVKISAPSTWAASTAYSSGDFVKSAAGDFYECTTAGTSGASAPTWDTTIGNTTIDNTATWTRRDNYEPDDRASGYLKASVAATLATVAAGKALAIISQEAQSKEATDSKNVKFIRTDASDTELFDPPMAVATDDFTLLDHGVTLTSGQKLKFMADSENIKCFVSANEVTA